MASSEMIGAGDPTSVRVAVSSGVGVGVRDGDGDGVGLEVAVGVGDGLGVVVEVGRIVAVGVGVAVGFGDCPQAASITSVKLATIRPAKRLFTRLHSIQLSPTAWQSSA